MADTISKEKRSWTMSRVKSVDNRPETRVRKYLFHNGYRYRKNVKTLPGKPDIALPKYHSVIFVNGCFWHRHPYCKNTRTPKTNVDFWTAKFDRNVSNDQRHYRELSDMGWHVIVIWECEIKKNFEITMKQVMNELDSYYLEPFVSKTEPDQI